MSVSVSSQWCTEVIENKDLVCSCSLCVWNDVVDVCVWW